MKELRISAKVAELELATSITPALAIQADIKALISTTQDTGIDNPGATTSTERHRVQRETTSSILLCIASTTTGSVESDVMTVNMEDVTTAKVEDISNKIVRNKSQKLLSAQYFN